MTENLKVLHDIPIDNTLPEDYGSALEMIVDKIKAAQIRAIRAVNFELVGVYKDIGKVIH